MTSVASTSYYPSTSSRANAGPAGRASESAYDVLYSNQERETKPQAKAAVETSVQIGGPNPRQSYWITDLQGKLVDLGAGVRLIDVLEPIPLSKVNKESHERFINSTEMMLEHKYTRMPEEADPSNNPLTKPYADIVVKGRVVATIDNQGIVTSKDDLLKQRYRDVLGSASGTYGPDMAERIAKSIAKVLGGSVAKQHTALTQAQLQALPQLENPQPWIDYDAMFADPEYAQLQEMRQKRDDYLAQSQTGGASQVPSSGN